MNAQTFSLRKCRQNAPWDQSYPHARRHASQHGVIRGELDRALGHLTTTCIEVFKPLSMRASVLKNDDGWRQAAFLADRRMIGGCNDHQLFVKGKRLLERRVRDRLGD